MRPNNEKYCSEYVPVSEHVCFSTLNILRDRKGKKIVICTMDDVRGDVLWPQHGTTPAAIITNKI